MLSNAENALLQKLKQMQQFCHEVQLLLIHDKNAFVANKLGEVTHSNEKKTLLLNQLNQSITEYETLKTNLQQQKIPLSSSTETAIQALKYELKKCYETLTVNSNIVYHNLQNLKSIWDKLLQFQNDKNCLYDNKGSKR